jgi:hypothetical protein
MTINRFSLQWSPRPDIAAFHTFLYWINFDLDVFTPSCLFKWSPSYGVYLNLAIPIVYIIYLVPDTIWSITKVLRKWTPSPSEPARPRFLALKVLKEALLRPKELRETGMITFMSGSVFRLKADVRVPISKAMNRTISNYMTFCTIYYNVLVYKSLSNFESSCLSLSGQGNGGMSVLESSPEVECGSIQHNTLMAVSSFGVFFYVVGVPMSIFIILTYYRQHNTLNSPTSIERFGDLYTNYKPRYYFWEVVLLLRRFVLNIIAIVLYRDGQQQVLVAIAGLSFNLWMSAMYMPFKDLRLNFLDNLSVVCLIVYLCIALICDKIDANDETEASKLKRCVEIMASSSLLVFFF